jgi:hypothetical protein
VRDRILIGGGNVPRPTGGNNVVGGNKEDQCRNL